MKVEKEGWQDIDDIGRTSGSFQNVSLERAICQRRKKKEKKKNQNVFVSHQSLSRPPRPSLSRPFHSTRKGILSPKISNKHNIMGVIPQSRTKSSAPPRPASDVSQLYIIS